MTNFAAKILVLACNPNLIVKNITLIFLSLAFILLSSSYPEGTKKYKVKKVVIDAGHGGKDPGCLGKISHESDITLAMALEIGKQINKLCPDIKVIYTRTENKFVELHDRAGIANKNNADLFISIHCNSSPNKEIFGTETYTMGTHKTEDNLEVAKRENSVVLQEEDYLEKYDGFDPNSPMANILFANYQNGYVTNSILFAQKVENKFTVAGRKDRGVRQAGFLVLWKTSMPSALIEIGYLSNKLEEKFLNDKVGQTKLAKGIAEAFQEYRTEIEG